jgi:hypothetical protein
MEQLIRQLVDLNNKIKELEEKKRVVMQEILVTMPGNRWESERFRVIKVQLCNIKTSLEDARSLGLTLIHEVPDKAAIKTRYFAGEKIPDVSVSQHVRVIPKSC